MDISPYVIMHLLFMYHQDSTVIRGSGTMGLSHCSIVDSNIILFMQLAKMNYRQWHFIHSDIF